MRVALAQINPTVGAVPHNERLVVEGIERAREAGAELVVFPELALVGYPPRDLLEHHSLIDANLAALERVAAATARPGSPGAIVGYVERRARGEGKGLYNAAAVIDGGRVLSRHFKSLLPTYDVFDELRHFHPAESVHPAEFRGRRLAVTICEDFWNDRLYWKRREYPFDPVEELAATNPDFMVTISASPYWLGKPALRDSMYAAAARRHGVALASVNMVGGNDGILFDGRSEARGADGVVFARGRSFEEDFVVVEAPERGAKAKLSGAKAEYEQEHERGHEDEDDELLAALAMGVRDYAAKCGFKRVLIGLSGGIDSALVAAIAVRALGADAVTGVAMPSRFSSDHSLSDAAALARNLGIEFHSLAVAPLYDRFLETLAPLFAGTSFGVAEENLQARIRGNLLMALSNKFGSLVLATGNKSEMAVGYCTLYGDMSGGLAVIADVLKTRVRSMSRRVNRDRELIPWNTIEKPPSAELRPGQLDSDSLPPYEVLDPIVAAYVERRASVSEIVAEGHDVETVRRVARMIDRNEYKRQQAAVVLKVTGKAFGEGRRMPIARGDWSDAP